MLAPTTCSLIRSLACVTSPLRLDHPADTLVFPSDHLWHMPQTGSDGLDVYAWDESGKAWRHVPSVAGIEEYGGQGMVTGVVHRPEPVVAATSTFTTYLVYLPLRNAPGVLMLGLPTESSETFVACTSGRSSEGSGSSGGSRGSHGSHGAAVGCAAMGVDDPAPRFMDKPPVIW